MAEGGTRADYQDWVEPHLTYLARYAGRLVAPDQRDEVVRQALIRAYQRWSTYDDARATPLVWLLGLVAHESRGEDSRLPGRAVVELVDQAAQPGTLGRDVDLERAVEGLGRRERRVVDLRYFVGLDLEPVALVVRRPPGAVEATLHQARDRLGLLVGDGDAHLMEQRLSAAARHWQDDQPPPPDVPLRRLHETPRRHLSWRRPVAVAAAVLVAGGAVAALNARHSHGDHAPEGGASLSPTPRVHRAVKAVPFRDLEAHHPALSHEANGVLTTPYDAVTAVGEISGTLHPGDVLAFDAVLESPGLLSLQPCPDYTITFGTQATTRQLNCAQVPYLASLVRPTGQVSSFRPVLPAGTEVIFHMRVTVPDVPGPQKVLWALDGPATTPGFSGLVSVTPR